MKQLIAPAGERTKILHVVSDSIPQTVRFTARRVSGGPDPRGTVEIVRRPWFFRKPPETHALAGRQTFSKGFADADYAIYVTPQEDTEIAFETRHFERKKLFLALGGLVAIAILAVLLVPLIG